MAHFLELELLGKQSTCFWNGLWNAGVFLQIQERSLVKKSGDCTYLGPFVFFDIQKYTFSKYTNAV